MPLQNRVTPSGGIIATPHRGMFTGNRGIIHDPATKTLLKKRWSSPAWITCVCEFWGWRRKVMGGRSWTELFFLDEATAFAAGHRPCFFCRRDDANRSEPPGRLRHGAEQPTGLFVLPHDQGREREDTTFAQAPEVGVPQAADGEREEQRERPGGGDPRAR